jgi:hypothetical protein
MSTDLPTPNTELVRRECQEFDADPVTGLADRMLVRVFQKFPANSHPEHVLLKVVVLNRLYSTSIYDVTGMTAHIVASAIDRDLNQQAIDAVTKISKATLGGQLRRTYSFATKYCSFHRPDTYPIYDSIVEDMLWRYRQRDRFSDFRRSDLRVYATFLQVMIDFRKAYCLDDCSFKQIDKVLWRLGRSRSQSTSLA